MKDIIQYLPLLNVLIIPLFAWVVAVERRLARLETSLHYVEKRKEGE